jgi:hypothetical protein
MTSCSVAARALVFALIVFPPAAEAAADDNDEPPYPRSRVIKRLTWDEQVLKLRDGAGDNWPITWVDKDLQITSWGDGEGFQPGERRLSLGFARLTGEPPGHAGEDFETNIDTPHGGGPSAIKASGLLMVDGVLHVFVRNYRPAGPKSDDFTNSRLGWSKDQGRTWAWADWHFADTFGCPEFVQFGMNYKGSRDEYVYVVSQGNDSAYGYSPHVVLARVPKKHVPDRMRWEFFADFGEVGQPAWTPDLKLRKPVFTDPNGTQRVAMVYNAPLKRYLLTTSHRAPGGDADATHTPALGVFDAPDPWGPWTTVAYDHHWSGEHRTYHHKFPTKWISADGREMYLLYSGLDGGLYTFCLKKATLDVEPPQTAKPDAAKPQAN